MNACSRTKNDSNKGNNCWIKLKSERMKPSSSKSGAGSKIRSCWRALSRKSNETMSKKDRKDSSWLNKRRRGTNRSRRLRSSNWNRKHKSDRKRKVSWKLFKLGWWLIRNWSRWSEMKRVSELKSWCKLMKGRKQFNKNELKKSLRRSKDSLRCKQLNRQSSSETEKPKNGPATKKSANALR